MLSTIMKTVTSTYEKEFPVMEIFYSLQGEGRFSGVPAVFIRLGGCDVGCHWCDVKESWNADAHTKFSVSEVISETNKFPANRIIVTGGEPLMYNLNELTKSLLLEKKIIHLETSGAYLLSGKWHWICLSPKKTMPPHQEIYKQANELKIIIHNHDDFIWAEKNAQYVSKDCVLYLQPEWGKKEKMMPLIVEYVKSNPQWNVCLQTHKYLNIP
jgi:7-carboxy-7-deazaguanine synthase